MTNHAHAEKMYAMYFMFILGYNIICYAQNKYKYLSSCEDIIT